MHLIIWAFALLGIWAVMKMTPGQAFMRVYLPVLLIFPDSFQARTPGLPDPTANMAVMIPIFLATLARYGSTWRPSFTDFLVIGLAVTMSVSEYINTNYSEAQNLMFGVLFQIVAPYLVVRLVVEQERLHVELAKRFVYILFVIGVLGLYEFKMGWNPFIVWPDMLFHQADWVTTFRYGFARVAGPYGHCILAGMMMIMAYRLNRWLEWGGHWEPVFKRFPNLPLPKARIITLALLVASITTFARGPWMGGVFGAVFVNAGRHPKRKKALGIAFGLIGLVAIPGYIGFQSYLDVKPGVEMTASQETAMYRKVLFEKYYEIALDHAWLGWGRNTWPKIPGMGSIDNYFLLLSLMHGLLATGLLLGVSFWLVVRLYLKGMKEPPEANSLAFTFLGIILAILFSLVTVYLGMAVMPAYFLILGWAEAYVHGKGYRAIAGAGVPAVPAPAGPFRFRRVIR